MPMVGVLFSSMDRIFFGRSSGKWFAGKLHRDRRPVSSDLYGGPPRERHQTVTSPGGILHTPAGPNFFLLCCDVFHATIST